MWGQINRSMTLFRQVCNGERLGGFGRGGCCSGESEYAESVECRIDEF